MKKVLLLGDSIRMGYQTDVRRMLAGECEVLYDGQDNGRFAAYTLWQANQMFKRYGRFDVVHWNNGYWDMNLEPPMDIPMHSTEEYLHFLQRIIREIRRNGAKIIFATTTPIPSSGDADDAGIDVQGVRCNDLWVRRYNEAARALMQEEGIPVNDLYALCKEDANLYKCEDRLHLTAEGYRRCAEQAAAMIRRVLE